VVSFGSSGIRGVFGTDITPELFIEIGGVVASRYRRILIGRDVRTSSLLLSNAFISGALSSGGILSDGGVLSTPTVAFGAKRHDCGVVITASHNPPEYNGIKLWNSSGIAFDEQQQKDIEEALAHHSFEKRPWNRLGELGRCRDLSLDHADAIADSIGPVNLKVVVDCGCGSTGAITPLVLRKMGCKVVALNAQFDGHFPGRSPEPSEENLDVLRKAVPATGADLGLAHDGDGDRVVAVDEKGAYVGGDKLLPLLASKLVEKTVVVPVDASMAVDDALPGAKVWRTRVGDVYVAQEVQRRKADFGGEPSGTFIFPTWGLFPDGIYGAALIASLVAKEKLSEQIARLPSYPTMRASFQFESSKRADVSRMLEQTMSSVEGELTKVDGWRVGFKDGWCLVRISGTEPKVRLQVEARSEQRTKEIYESLVSKVKAVLR
jgi:phosphoglucosamine mutase